MTTKLKFPKAVWTPWAEILCYECHGDIFRNRDYDPVTREWKDKVLEPSEFEELLKSIPLLERKSITKCTKCEKQVQVEESCALENNVVFALRELGINAEMAQTGGMNSAAYIPKVDSDKNGYYYVTYNWDGDERYMAGSYDFEGECVDDFEENSLVTKHFHEVIEFFKLVEGLEKIEAK